MNIIKQPSKDILNKIGTSITDSTINYRIMKYCVMSKVKGGMLWSNQITRSIIFIPTEQLKLIFNKENNTDYINFLRRNYFLVPEDFNEFEFINNYRKRYSEKFSKEIYLKNITGYTILTTTACNARCFYCYEKGTKSIPMTIETAEKIVQYIIKHTPKNKKASLRWFGGEPLFNAKVINHICQRLREENVAYTSSMTSNGYLFGDEIVKKAIDLWLLKSVQITLDGTEEVYNKVKNYIYKDISSAYKNVLSNIKRLISAKIHVSIRMNLDQHNFENLKELVTELKKEIGHNNYFSMYVYPLFDEENKRTEEEKEAVYKALKEVEEVIMENGYSLGSNIGNNIRLRHCMTDSGNSVVFAPDGSLGLCEHYTDRDFYSHVDNLDNINWDKVQEFREYNDYYEFCEHCPNYPNCILVKICADQGQCDKYRREWNIRKLKYLLLNAYLNYLKSRNKK